MGNEVYEVRIRGPVASDQIEELCADFELQADIVLHGVVRDQAMIHGLLDRLRDLGMQLIDVHRVTVGSSQLSAPHDAPSDRGPTGHQPNTQRGLP